MSNNLQEITLAEAAEALDYIVRYDPHQAVMFWGLPGVGKSAMVQQTADKYGVPMVDWRLSQMDPPDIRGIPSVRNGTTVFNPPSELPSDPESEGILFLDEINAGARATQAAAMQLVLDRRAGEHRIPDKWVIVAAGNEVTHGAVANAMPTALANRFMHFVIRPDMDTLVHYALSNGWDPTIVQFLRFRPELIHQMSVDRDTKAFPSPRAWEFVQRKRPLSIQNAELRRNIVAAAVGMGAMIEFEGFLQLFMELPSIDEVLLSPHTAPIPSKPDGKYAISSALMKKVSEGTIEAVLIYLSRMEIEFAAVVVKDIMATNKRLTQTHAMVNWLAEHNDFFMA